MTKLVVAAVLGLAALAVADALRGLSPAPPAPSASPAAPAAAPTTFERAGSGDFATDGAFLHSRVLRGGREVLGEDEVEGAFPPSPDGPLDISHVAVAPDGTLVLGVYRFPAGHRARSALELWRGRRHVASFPVPRGSLGGGIGFNRDGSLIATFAHDGRVAAVFDRSGKAISLLGGEAARDY